MANTTNYNWETPDDTDLVKDGAAAIRTLGSSVDTTTKALNPSTTLGDIEYRSATANTNTRLAVGTTGQVLTVAGGVPSWATPTTGDIEGVTAGTGISGGGTSGTVTITNDMATTITASGDIVVGTGSGTYDNLPIGTTGQVLTADTTVSPYKVKWAAPAGGGGKVLQVVSATTATRTTIASTTYTDTTLTASITPSAASSKVLVLVTQQMTTERGIGQYAQAGGIRLLRGATVVYKPAEIGFLLYNTDWQGSGEVGKLRDIISLSYLDSPATTSATTYKTQGAVVDTANSGLVKFQHGETDTVASIILLEIGA